MTDFLAATRGAPAHPSLLKALDSWSQAPARALDLGCGAGRDSLHLLAQGWTVIALDSDPRALTCLQEQLGSRTGLTTLCQPFESAQPLPAVELINASFALPFCPPAAFAGLWTRIEQALLPGGLFCGHFFGPNDDWAGGRLSIHSEAELRQLFDDWQLTSLQELEWDGRTAVGSSKHWHLFEIIARRR